jgi:thiosulfate reductase cytochrome b subunit
VIPVKALWFRGDNLIAGFSFESRKSRNMKAATQRKIMRWIHIIASIPIIGYIYGPVKNFPNAVHTIQWVLFPLIVLSGLWVWKGHVVKNWFKKKKLAKALKSSIAIFS